MPSSVKLAGKQIDTVYCILGAKTALYRAVALLKQNSYFNSFNGPGIVNQSFRILIGGACFFINAPRQQAYTDAPSTLEL